MKLQLAEIGGSTGSMYLDELQTGGRSGEMLSSSAERGGQMKRVAGFEQLEQMSLESLLYYVLVGGGRISKQREET